MTALVFIRKPYVHNPQKRCATCRWFQGAMLHEHLVCEHPRFGRSINSFTARTGCCSWERAPGSDDDDPPAS